MTLDDLLALQKKVERLRREADRADGAYAQLLARLKDEYACGDFERAEKMVREMIAEEARLEQKLVGMKEKWQKQYGDLL